MNVSRLIFEEVKYEHFNRCDCYGLDGDGNEEEISVDWLGEEEGFDDFLAKLAGIESLEPNVGTDRYGADPKYKKEWVKYWDKKRQLEEKSEVQLVHHCQLEYSMYILAVKASVKEANRGKPIELGQSIIAPPEWRETLRAFCEKANIPFQEPQFILCSYWG